MCCLNMYMVGYSVRRFVYVFVHKFTSSYINTDRGSKKKKKSNSRIARHIAYRKCSAMNEIYSTYTKIQIHLQLYNIYNNTYNKQPNTKAPATNRENAQSQSRISVFDICSTYWWLWPPKNSTYCYRPSHYSKYVGCGLCSFF